MIEEATCTVFFACTPSGKIRVGFDRKNIDPMNDKGAHNALAISRIVCLLMCQANRAETDEAGELLNRIQARIDAEKQEGPPMPSPALKPCPFCGGVAVYLERPKIDNCIPADAAVYCEDCEASSARFATRKEAAAAWNRRAGGGKERRNDRS